MDGATAGARNTPTASIGCLRLLFLETRIDSRVGLYSTHLTISVVLHRSLSLSSTVRSLCVYAWWVQNSLNLSQCFVADASSMRRLSRRMRVGLIHEGYNQDRLNDSGDTTRPSTAVRSHFGRTTMYFETALTYHLSQRFEFKHQHTQSCIHILMKFRHSGSSSYPTHHYHHHHLPTSHRKAGLCFSLH